MAELESKYYQVDGVRSESVANGRWFKAGVAFTVGACLGLLSIQITSSSAPIAAEPTNLVGQVALTPKVVSALGNSPFKRPALLALQALNRDPEGRGVSIRAVMSEAAAEAPAEAPAVAETVAKVEKSVTEKVREIAEGMPGATAPLGFWDPVGFSTKSSLGTLLFQREAELKHGRIGMLAFLGIVMGEKVAPLLGAPSSVPAVYQLKDTPMQNFWLAVLIAVSLPEWNKKEYSYSKIKKNGWWVIDEADKVEIPAGVIPGDYGFDPLGLKPKTEKDWIDMQNKELNNGRMAMLAAIAIVATEISTGQKTF